MDPSEIEVKFLQLQNEIRKQTFINEILMKDIDKLKYYSFNQHKKIEDLKKEIYNLKYKNNYNE